MQNRLLRAGIGLVAGALFSFASAFTFLKEIFWNSSLALRGLLLLTLVICAAVIFDFSIRWAVRWSGGFSRKKIIVLLGVCLLAGVYLAIALPVGGSFFPSEHTIQLVAGAEKNFSSRRNQVQLIGIHTIGMNQDLDLRNVCAGGWEFQDSVWISPEKKPGNLICRFFAIDAVKMVFTVGDSSGIVEIIVDQFPKTKADLYAETQASKTMRFALQNGLSQSIRSAWVFIAWGLWIGWLLFCIVLYFYYRPERKTSSLKGSLWAPVSLFLILIWSLYLIAYWPGFMNSDAQDQWRQMQTGIFNDWHPAFHTLTFWFITRLWFSPAAVALSQILVMGVLVGLILERLWRIGTHVWIIIFILGMLVLPNYSLAVISLWKDIPYSIAMLGFTYLILLIVESDGSWVQNSAAWIGLGIIGALSALYRHNGTPGVFITLGTLCLVWPKYKKGMILALLVALLLFVGVRGPLFQLVGVPLNSSNPGLGLAFAHLVARHTQADTPMSKEEGQLLASIRADGEPWPYNCYSNNHLAFDGKMNQGQLKTSTWELGKLAWQLSIRSPRVTFNHLLCNSAFIFRILPPMAGKIYMPYEASPIDISPVPSQRSEIKGIETLWPALEDRILDLVLRMYYGKLHWLFFRSPSWMYLLVFSAGIAAFRTRRWGYFLLPVPVLLNTLPLAFISFIQAFRLVMPVMLISLVFSGYLLTRDR